MATGVRWENKVEKCSSLLLSENEHSFVCQSPTMGPTFCLRLNTWAANVSYPEQDISMNALYRYTYYIKYLWIEYDNICTIKPTYLWRMAQTTYINGQTSGVCSLLPHIRELFMNEQPANAMHWRTKGVESSYLLSFSQRTFPWPKSWNGISMVKHRQFYNNKRHFNSDNFCFSVGRH